MKLNKFDISELRLFAVLYIFFESLNNNNTTDDECCAETFDDKIIMRIF